jgi:hypothetical protein
MEDRIVVSEGGTTPGASPDAPPPLPPPLAPERRLPLYTPAQVRIAGFLGGPFAAIYTLHQNFKQLGDSVAMKRTFWYGTAFCLGLLALLTVLPERFPNQVLPLAYSLGAGEIAKSRQLTKERIAKSSQYRRHSGWRVAGVSAIALVAFFLIALPLFLLLDYLGIIHLD